MPNSRTVKDAELTSGADFAPGSPTLRALLDNMGGAVVRASRQSGAAAKDGAGGE
jgi:hypothetical protein